MTKVYFCLLASILLLFTFPVAFGDDAVESSCTENCSNVNVTKNFSNIEKPKFYKRWCMYSDNMNLTRVRNRVPDRKDDEDLYGWIGQNNSGSEIEEVNIYFVDEESIANLNAQHMNQIGPTDVLAFPLDDPKKSDNHDEFLLLGDVVICPKVADRQATNHSYEAEISAS